MIDVNQHKAFFVSPTFPKPELYGVYEYYCFTSLQDIHHVTEEPYSTIQEWIDKGWIID